MHLIPRTLRNQNVDRVVQDRMGREETRKDPDEDNLNFPTTSFCTETENYAYGDQIRDRMEGFFSADGLEFP